MPKLAVLFSLIAIVLRLPVQPKEVLIIGTMHTVPNIVKHSYKPMLKAARDYGPEAIFVERPLPEDSLSWEYLKDGWSKSYQAFYVLADSLKQQYPFRYATLNRLLEKDFADMSVMELDTIKYSFGYLRDYANYSFYRFLQTYGLEGPDNPTRNENGDLTAPLAISFGIKRLKSMDDQQTNDAYHDAWRQCVKEGRENGNNDILRKLNKRDYRRSVLPAICRRLGAHTNKTSSLNRLHSLSSFTYVEIETEGCSLGDEFWRQRNHRMARNIGRQVLEGKETRNLVIVGAAHVIGLKEELESLFPELAIRLMRE